MVWIKNNYSLLVNSAHTHSFLYYLYFYTAIEDLYATETVWPTKPTEFAIWPFQKKVADLWGTALSPWPISNDNLGKPTTQPSQAVILVTTLAANDLFSVCFPAEYTDPVVFCMQVLILLADRKFPLERILFPLIPVITSDMCSSRKTTPH